MRFSPLIPRGMCKGGTITACAAVTLSSNLYSRSDSSWATLPNLRSNSQCRYRSIFDCELPYKTNAKFDENLRPYDRISMHLDRVVWSTQHVLASTAAIGKPWRTLGDEKQSLRLEGDCRMGAKRGAHLADLIRLVDPIARGA